MKLRMDGDQFTGQVFVQFATAEAALEASKHDLVVGDNPLRLKLASVRFAFLLHSPTLM